MNRDEQLRVIRVPCLKRFKSGFLVCVGILLFVTAGFSQSTDKENIRSLIEELTPSLYTDASFLNMDIMGFDLLDRKMNRKNPEDNYFDLGDKFYVVLYSKRKLHLGPLKYEYVINDYNLLFKHSSDYFIESGRTSSFVLDEEVNSVPENWEIGGVYKIVFPFQVPTSARPGTYTARINNQAPLAPPEDKAKDIKPIKINIQGLNVDYLNMVITGYDLFDENDNNLDPDNYIFSPNETCLVVVYAKSKETKIATAEDDDIKFYRGVFKHTSNYSFDNKETTSHIGDETVNLVPEQWTPGKVYKIQFLFEIPEAPLPGSYVMRINKISPLYSEKNKTQLNQIKIKVQGRSIDYMNMIITQFDILNRNRVPINPNTYIFSPKETLYVVRHAKPKKNKIPTSEGDDIHSYKGVLKHTTDYSIISRETVSLIGNETINLVPEKWTLGKTYKIRFRFQIPKNASAGNYVLRLNKVSALYSDRDKTQIDEIQIQIKR